MKLQTDQDEQGRVDDEVDGGRDEVAFQAGADRQDLQSAGAHVDARGDGGQDPRGA